MFASRSPAAVLIAACCLTSCASGLATGPLAVNRGTVFLKKRMFERTKIMTMGADGAADAKRRQVVAALKRFDQLAAMSSRGDPEGCSTALTELEALRETGAVFELGPNAHNRAMRVCSTDLETVESLYAQLAAEERQDAASLEALASIRLENDMLIEAAEAVAELLAPALEVRTNKLGRELPRKKVSQIYPHIDPTPALPSRRVHRRQRLATVGPPRCQVPERVYRVAHAVLEACGEAGLSEAALSGP